MENEQGCTLGCDFLVKIAKVLSRGSYKRGLRYVSVFQESCSCY